MRSYVSDIRDTDVVNAKDGSAVAQVLELTRGGVHHAFECIGLKQTAEQAFGMLARGGTATIIGMIKPGEVFYQVIEPEPPAEGKQ